MGSLNTLGKRIKKSKKIGRKKNLVIRARQDFEGKTWGKKYSFGGAGWDPFR